MPGNEFKLYSLPNMSLLQEFSFRTVYDNTPYFRTHLKKMDQDSESVTLEVTEYSNVDSLIVFKDG